MRLSFTQLALLGILFFLLFNKNTKFFNKLNRTISSFMCFLKKYNSPKKMD